MNKILRSVYALEARRHIPRNKLDAPTQGRHLVSAPLKGIRVARAVAGIPLPGRALRGARIVLRHERVSRPRGRGHVEGREGQQAPAELRVELEEELQVDLHARFKKGDGLHQGSCTGHCRVTPHPSTSIDKVHPVCLSVSFDA